VSDPRATADDAVERAEALVRLFSAPGPDFGIFRALAPAEVPAEVRAQLDHTDHMTVVMERLHGTPLGLRVVARARDAGEKNPWYAREILLLSPAGAVVQYGIVRIDLSHVDAKTAAAIRAARLPLGRVLIDAGLLRHVHAVALLGIEAGPRLAALFGPMTLPPGHAAATFGRVAEISLGGHPAVQLLEILPPCPLPSAGARGG